MTSPHFSPSRPAGGKPEAVLTDDHLADAYGGHFLRVGEHTLIVDDHAHH